MSFPRTLDVSITTALAAAHAVASRSLAVGLWRHALKRSVSAPPGLPAASCLARRRGTQITGIIRAFEWSSVRSVWPFPLAEDATVRLPMCCAMHRCTGLMLRWEFTPPLIHRLCFCVCLLGAQDAFDKSHYRMRHFGGVFISPYKIRARAQLSIHSVMRVNV